MPTTDGDVPEQRTDRRGASPDVDLLEKTLPPNIHRRTIGSQPRHPSVRTDDAASRARSTSLFNERGIVVRLRGRFGNQMFQYATGLALASRYGVPLLLDESILKHIDPGSYALDPIVPDARRTDLINAGKPLGAPLNDLLFRLLWRRRRYRERFHGFDEGLLDRPPPLILEGFFQSERYFQPVADKVRDLFDAFAARRAAETSLPRAVEGKAAVAMHFRRGDYPELYNFADLPMSYYQRAIAVLDALAPGPKHFLVFSDEPDWAEANTGWLAPRTIIRTGGPLGMYDEMIQIGRCAHAIIANSTFSWWGAYLRRPPTGITLAPRFWFDGHRRRSHATADLLPPDWIAL
jgi:Glycosyl transferase family 11